MTYLLFSVVVFELYSLTQSQEITKFNKCKDKYVFRYIIAILLIFFAGFRSLSVGTDTINYFDNFEIIDKTLSIETKHPFEFLFQLLNLICALVLDVNNGFRLLLVLCSMIIVINFMIVNKKMSDNEKLSFLIFYLFAGYLSSFNQLRQCVAISFLFLAFLSANKQNLSSYIAYVILACLFHKSAIVFLPVYFVLKCNKEKLLYLIYAITIVMFLILMLYYNQILKVFCNLLNYDYFDKYAKYEVQNAGITTILKVCMSSVFCIVVFIMTIFNSTGKNKISILQLNYVFMLACLFYILGIISNMLILRLAPLFYWILFLLAPKFISSFKSDKFKTVLFVFCTISLFAYTGLITMWKDIYGIVPYGIGFK